MFSWAKYPLVRVLIAYIIGIYLAFNATNIPLPNEVMLVGAAAVLLLSVVFNSVQKIPHRLTSVLTFCSIFVIGYAYTVLFIAHKNVDSKYQKTEKQAFYATVKQCPIEKSKSIKLICQVEAIQTDKKWIKTNFDLLLYLQKNKLSKQVQYGDKLLCFGQFNKIEHNKNPDGFDYQHYLKIKNIHVQSYCDSNNWQLSSSGNGNTIISLSIKWRNKFLDIFQKADMDMKEYGVIAAILLGADEYLDPELEQSYSAAGASHILCVSGMHVGIIFMIVSFLLRFLDNTFVQKLIRTILLLSVVWIYACITGLSPSVMRAATMFTFIAIAGIIKRQTNTYNSIYASMFVLLVINPLLIFEIGFQLSYLAVFGIVWLQKPLSNLYQCKTQAGNYLWNLVCVSITAQLFTAPIAMYYFHQFPNYFLLTNLVVISLSAFVVATGVATLAVSFWSFAFRWVSLLLTTLIKGMNFIIESIENLPFSTTTNISFSAFQTVLLYLIVICLASSFLYKYRWGIWGFFASLMVFLALEINTLTKNWNKEEMVVYSCNKTEMIDFYKHRQCISFYRDSLALEQVGFVNQNHQIANRCQSKKTIIGQTNIECLGLRLLILEKMPKATSCRTKIDYLILSNNQYYQVEKLCDMFEFKKLLLGSDMTPSRRKNLKNQCSRLSIDCYDLSQKALIVPLEK